MLCICRKLVLQTSTWFHKCYSLKLERPNTWSSRKAKLQDKVFSITDGQVWTTEGTQDLSK